MNNEVHFEPEKPNFKQLVLLNIQQLTNFPYIEADFDAITNYQLLCKVVEYLNKVIDNENKQNETLTNLYNAFVSLEDYVNNYFDNLDVQDEINNKLDEMAESGQLTDIIAQYLGLAGVLAFDTIADLEEAQNIVDGSTCRTLGANSYNDGKGAYYKIRPITSSDVVDGFNIIALDISNTLIGEKINEDIIDVTKYGVNNNGLVDVTQILQNLIDNNPLKSLYFPNGKYLISEPLKIKSGNETSVNLIFDDNAVLFTNTPIDELINIGKIFSGNYERYNIGNITTIKGGIFDATNTQRALYITSDRKQVRLLNLNIINVKNIGIYLDRNISTTTSISTDTLLNNISITGTKDYNDDNTGIYLYGTDNEINNLRISGIKKAIDINGGGNEFNNCHLTAAYNDITSEMINNSIGVNVRGSGNNFFNNFYIDTYGQNFVFNSENMRTYINNLQVFYYLNDSNSKNYGFIYNARCYCYCTNCMFEFPANGENKVVKTTNSLEYNSRKYPTLKKLIIFKNSNAYNLTSDDDWFLESNLNDRFTNNYNLNYNPWTVNMVQNEWYKVALLNGGIHEFTIQLANDQISHLKINVNNSSPSITVTDIFHTTGGHYQKYEVALANGYTDDTANYMAYLMIRALDNNSSLNVNISEIKQLWTNQTFACGKTSPETNPTILTSANLLP